jgi:hypothetical protein
MKVGDTGFIVSGENPATGDCFWQAMIVKIDDAKKLIYVRLENNYQGWVKKSDFTPRYIKGAPSPAFKNFIDDKWAGIL